MPADYKPDENQLLPEVAYTIGKFRIVLSEQTGDLKVLVHENRGSMLVKPSSSNLINIGVSDR